MSIWTLFQVMFNLVMFAGISALYLRLRRPPQDDPRLSRGLQLLQTKITVLEDLSDRTDAQVKQLSGLLDQKTRIVQNKILEAEQQILKIDHSMNKSMEVAEIFQDKIPHQEILERQRTVEYVKAARMAHSGMSTEEISETVHLPREQIELIAKFNRDQLMFDESQLPQWATREVDGGSPSFAMNDMDFAGGLETTKPGTGHLAKIEQDFKNAVEAARQFEANPPPSIMDSKVAETLRNSVHSGVEHMQPAMQSIKATAQTLKDKLVATAEDMLRTQSNHAARAYSAQANPVIKKVTDDGSGGPTFKLGQGDPMAKVDSSIVKKVIFPRIDKDS